MLECEDTTYSLLPLPSMGSYKNKSKSSQPRRVGRPRKAKGKGKPAIDPPVPSLKSHPKPHPKGRSVLLEPHVLSAENESDAILAATEGLLGLSKAGKTRASDSEVEDSIGSNTPSVKGRGVAVDLDEDDKVSKSSSSNSEEDD